MIKLVITEKLLNSPNPILINGVRCIFFEGLLKIFITFLWCDKSQVTRKEKVIKRNLTDTSVTWKADYCL